MDPRPMYCVDFETTRDSDKELHIIEIGAILLDDALVPCQEFSSLVRPPCNINPIDARVTGLCDRDLDSAESCSSVFPRLLAFVSGGIVLAHNAKYERKVVEATCQRLGIPFPRWLYVDTLKLARRFIKASSYSLPKLLAGIGISYQQHRALADCIATASLFGHIVSEIAKTGDGAAIERALDIGGIEQLQQRALF